MNLRKHILLTTLPLILSGCSTSKKADIVTTLFPQYDVARRIAGDKLSVSMMTPLGSEVHDYSPTTSDVLNAQKAKLFIYTSDELESWAPSIGSQAQNELNMSTMVTPEPAAEIAEYDSIHFWTDPLIMLQYVTIIKDAIIEIDTENAEYYEENANSYYDEILAVHEAIFLRFAPISSIPTFFFYGHSSLNNFANRYGILIDSLSDSHEHEDEPSPGELIAFKNKVKSANASVVFVEELTDLKAPQAFQSELASEGYTIELLELHSFHNISKKQFKEGVTYVDLLEQNFTNLKTAFN